ncbi:MAG TPA: hypothetical protein PLQ93_12830 [Bacteroidia bacterium]|nr:hypothetical protein [Bacteroidia bacterium]
MRILKIILILTWCAFTGFSQSWQQCSSPPNGSIFSMVTIGSELFTGSNNGGIYHSSDLGVTWQQSNGGLPNHVISLCTDGVNLYAGTSGFSSTAIYKSGDLGQSWTDVTPTGLNNASDVRSLVTDGTYLFAGISGLSAGVYKSSLNGLSPSSWTSFDNGIQGLFVRMLSICASTLFASTYILNDPGNGIYQSPTSTDQWVSVSSGLTPVNNYIRSFAIRSNTILAGSILGTSPSIYLSTNSGVTWSSSVSNQFTANPNVHALLFNNNEVYAGTELGGVFRSGDNGLTWQSFNAGMSGPNTCNLNIRSLARIGSSLFAGTDCGVWKITLCNGSPANAINTTGAGSSTVCSSNSASISASGAGTIHWYTLPSGGSAILTGTSLISPPLFANTTYYAEAFTCAPSVARTPITLTVEALPQLITGTSNSISCPGEQIGISTMGAVSCTWQPGNIVGTSVFVNPIASTNYTVTGTGPNGCTSSATLMHVVTDCSGLEKQENYQSNPVLVFPNPCQGDVNFKNVSLLPCTFSLYNEIGQAILSGDIPADAVLALHRLKPGLYAMKVFQGTAFFTGKILVSD